MSTDTLAVFLSNARHAVRNRETVRMGGGDFSPTELSAVVDGLSAAHGLAATLRRFRDFSHAALAGGPHGESLDYYESEAARALAAFDNVALPGEAPAPGARVAPGDARLADALRALCDAVAPTRAGKRDGYTFGLLSRRHDEARAVLASWDAGTRAPGEAWRREDDETAWREGWCISNASDGVLEIQRIDEPEDESAPKFNGDAAALIHVYSLALRGSALHRRAILSTLQQGGEA